MLHSIGQALVAGVMRLASRAARSLPCIRCVVEGRRHQSLRHAARRRHRETARCRPQPRMIRGQAGHRPMVRPSVAEWATLVMRPTMLPVPYGQVRLGQRRLVRRVEREADQLLAVAARPGGWQGCAGRRRMACPCAPCVPRPASNGLVTPSVSWPTMSGPFPGAGCAGLPRRTGAGPLDAPAFISASHTRQCLVAGHVDLETELAHKADARDARGDTPAMLPSRSAR